MSVYRFDGWQFDTNRLALQSPDGTPVPLTPREIVLLRKFLDQPQTNLSRDFLADAVYGDHPPDEYLRNLTVHVCRLRTKLRDREQNWPMIRTVRYGYWFCTKPEIIVSDRIQG